VTVQFLAVALRRLFGWNEERLAQELAQLGIAQISHTTVGRIFVRYHLATRTYHTLAKREASRKDATKRRCPTSSGISTLPRPN